jgi:hypothetical protein
MTAVAIHGELEVRRRPHLVARLANHLLMYARQRKSRLPPVIETPSRKSVGIMARAATWAQPTLMEVLVTFLASDQRVLVRRSPMAFLAGDRGMKTNQRKACQLVIKQQVPSPIRIIVTSLTPLA